MKILAIDTSTLRAAVALADRDPGSAIAAPPADPATDPGRRHGRNLVPAIRDLLRAEGSTLADVGWIAVGVGPGSYTGLRIGLTAARTLAYASGATLVGLDSLEAIAHAAPADALRVAVVADAQRGDLYAAAFARTGPGGDLARVAPTRIERAEAWAAGLAPGTLVLGPALDRIAVDWPAGVTLGTAEEGHPRPGPLIDLARRAAAEGRRDDLWTLEPAYFRRSAAEDQWERRR